MLLFGCRKCFPKGMLEEPSIGWHPPRSCDLCGEIVTTLDGGSHRVADTKRPISGIDATVTAGPSVDDPPSWENTYLLAWYDRAGRPHLSTWSGDLPMVHVVVTGCREIDVPMWNAPVAPSVRLHAVPGGENPDEYAAKLGGLHAFGWRVAVDRRPWSEDEERRMNMRAALSSLRSGDPPAPAGKN